ncbi:MAG: hypothetical protein U0805_12855 [Pirellulales bacterium]
MYQAIRTLRFFRSHTATSGCAALVFLSFISANSFGVNVLRTRTDLLDHNQTKSAFFTTSSDGSVTFLPTDEGWAPKTPTKAGEAASTTPTKTYTIVGNSTSGGNWTDGNGVPAGITLSFTAEFTISALPLSGGSYLTNPGPSGGTLGRGIGITQVLGGNDDIDKPDGFQVSAATISNLSFTGSLTEPGFTFTPGGISDFGTRVFRSNNFDETMAGMLLTQGSETIGFGLVSGTVASNQLVNNNFGTPGGTEAGSSIFPRRVGPYTLVVDGPDQTTNVSVIKGIGVAYDVTYDITAAAAPLTGDYNSNGVVDAADYVVWREGNLAADGNGDLAVDQADYDLWRANFGNTNTPGSGSLSGGTAVPEPAVAAIAVLGLFGIASSRRIAGAR